jgi:hypothetical protein
MIMPTRSEEYYQNKLQKYFDKYYYQYEYSAEFYVNPEINKWRFVIPELSLNILLTCYDDGRIVETREGLV